MTITREDAIDAATKFLSSRMQSRLEIVQSISGPVYTSCDFNFSDWIIIHVQPEEILLDGRQRYVLVHKATGETRDMATS